MYSLHPRQAIAIARQRLQTRSSAGPVIRAMLWAYHLNTFRSHFGPSFLDGERAVLLRRLRCFGGEMILDAACSVPTTVSRIMIKFLLCLSAWANTRCTAPRSWASKSLAWIQHVNIIINQVQQASVNFLDNHTVTVSDPGNKWEYPC